MATQGLKQGCQNQHEWLWTVTAWANYNHAERRDRLCDVDRTHPHDAHVSSRVM